MTALEYGRDWNRATGFYVADDDMPSLDFDVWAYARPLGGWTFVLRQNAPQQMAEELGVPVTDEKVFTIEVSSGLVEYLDGALVDPGALRVDWTAVPPDAQAHVFAAAGTGWVWNGVEHRYDPAQEAWVG